MILRKTQMALLVVLLSVGVCFAEDPPSKNYDTSDWIPIAQPDTLQVPEKKAQARVLNLADPPQKNFFPEDNVKPQQQFQQYLRETTVVNPFALRGQQQQYAQPPQMVSVPVRDQPYRFELAQVKTVPQKVVDDIQAQYYLQAQPIRQHFPPETQFVMHQIPASVLPQSMEQPVPQLTTRPKVQYVMQGPQSYGQQNHQYHTIPQEYLNAPFVTQPEIYDQQYHTMPVSHPVTQFKVRAPANKTKTYIARPVLDQPLPQQHKVEKEHIQLVYVPLESLKQNVEPISYQRPRVVPQKNVPKPTPPPPQRIVSHRQQQQFKNIETDFVKQALDAHKLQLQLQQPSAYTVPQVNIPSTYPTTTTTTTRRPAIKKRKPHQPPLAVYMGGEGRAAVSDVLALLKNAKSIDVQDSFGPHSPQVFVGPSSLQAPDGYAKFELPYLSNIDNNRVERKVEQLPFFVAPLSYKAPSGYSKIPLPSPHVGSVVVSTKANLLHDKINNTQSTPVLIPQPQYDYRQYYNEKPTTTYESATISTTTVAPPSRPLPVNQVVNQYEIDQINSQFIPSSQFHYESLPISKYQEYDVSSKEEQPYRSTTPQSKSTTMTPTPKHYSLSPTQNTFVDSSEEINDKYTVLEEYNINNKDSTPNYIQQYNSPESVVYYGTASPQPIYTRNSPRPTPNNQQHQLSQDIVDYQILRTRPTEDTHESKYRTELVQVTSTEKTHQRQSARPLLRPQVKPGDFYLEDNLKYKDSNEDQTQYKSIEEISKQPIQPNDDKQYISEAYYNQGLDPEKYQEYYNLPSLLPPVSQSLPGLINELQDQSLKSLLIPVLLAPTTSKNINYENRDQEYMEVSSVRPPRLPIMEISTEATLPTETTTRINRGRQRGNRYTTVSSVASDVTRRTIARSRRPYTSRTKEDGVTSTTEYSNINSESRKTAPINRSRFRTRGRPASNTEEKSTAATIEEAASSTLRGHSINALTSYQIDEQNSRPQISNIPNIKYDEEQYQIKDYQSVYTPNNEPGTTLLDVVRQIPRQQIEEVTEAAKLRGRSRVRSRTRPTTTVAPQEEKLVDDLKEVYGFIKVPNFKKSSDDSRESQKYSSTYVSSTSRPISQYREEGVVTGRPNEIRYFIQEQGSPSSTPVYFIGEIRPKYQPSTGRIYESTQEVIRNTDRYVATTPSEYSTEAVNSKVRNRVRLVGRVRDNNEDVTITPIRTRTRGKLHYMPPQSFTNKKSSEEEDIQGGNYPELYLKSKENYTPRPSFQITVNPADDQVPHSSFYQPKYLPHSPETSGVLNDIPVDAKQSNVNQYTSEPAPTALPFVGFMRTQDSAEDISTEGLADITQDALNIVQDISPMQSTTSSTDTTQDEVITKAFKRPYGKRRGLWKLVKARPVEVFEGAESQSLNSNKNNIDVKLKPTVHMYQVTEDVELYTNIPDVTAEFNPTSEVASTATEVLQETQKSESLFDSLYEMFGITQTQESPVDLIETINNSTDEIQTDSENIDTTTTEKTTSENYNEFIMTTDADDITPKEIQTQKDTTEAITVPIVEPSTEPQKAEEEIRSTMEQPMSYVTPMSLHMWTSTSTEVSHETEICYKGKCVKTKESK